MVGDDGYVVVGVLGVGTRVAPLTMIRTMLPLLCLSEMRRPLACLYYIVTLDRKVLLAVLVVSWALTGSGCSALVIPMTGLGYPSFPVLMNIVRGRVLLALLPSLREVVELVVFADPSLRLGLCRDTRRVVAGTESAVVSFPVRPLGWVLLLLMLPLCRRGREVRHL